MEIKYDNDRRQYFLSATAFTDPYYFPSDQAVIDYVLQNQGQDIAFTRGDTTLNLNNLSPEVLAQLFPGQGTAAQSGAAYWGPPGASPQTGGPPQVAGPQDTHPLQYDPAGLDPGASAGGQSQGGGGGAPGGMGGIGDMGSYLAQQAALSGQSLQAQSQQFNSLLDFWRGATGRQMDLAEHQQKIAEALDLADMLGDYQGKPTLQKRLMTVQADLSQRMAQHNANITWAQQQLAERITRVQPALQLMDRLGMASPTFMGKAFSGVLPEPYSTGAPVNFLPGTPPPSF